MSVRCLTSAVICARKRVKNPQTNFNFQQRTNRHKKRNETKPSTTTFKLCRRTRPGTTMMSRAGRDSQQRQFQSMKKAHERSPSRMSSNGSRSNKNEIQSSQYSVVEGMMCTAYPAAIVATQGTRTGTVPVPGTTNSNNLNPRKEEKNQHCHCYLLRSLDPKHPNKTYVGFTVDPKRRLRQHNGLVKGGARQTSRQGRPWEFTVILHGFHTQVKGLQFEWAWQHVEKSLAVRAMIGSEPAKVLKRRQRSTKGQLTILKTLVTYVASELTFETIRQQQQQQNQPPKQRGWRKKTSQKKKTSILADVNSKKDNNGDVGDGPSSSSYNININNGHQNPKLQNTENLYCDNIELTLYFFDQKFFDLYKTIECPMPEPVLQPSTGQTSKENGICILPKSSPTVHIQTRLVQSLEDMPFFLDRKRRPGKKKQKEQQQSHEQNGKSPTSSSPTFKLSRKTVVNIECIGCHRPITSDNSRSIEDTVQCTSCGNKMHAVCGEIYRLELDDERGDNRRGTNTNVSCPYCKSNCLVFESDDDDDDDDDDNNEDMEYEIIDHDDPGPRISHNGHTGHGETMSYSSSSVESLCNDTESDAGSSSSRSLLSTPQKHRKPVHDNSIIVLSDDDNEEESYDEGGKVMVASARGDGSACLYLNETIDSPSSDDSCNGIMMDHSWQVSSPHGLTSSPTSSTPTLAYHQDYTNTDDRMILCSPPTSAKTLPSPPTDTSSINGRVSKDHSIICIDSSSDDEEEENDSSDDNNDEEKDGDYDLARNDGNSLSSSSDASCMSSLSPLRVHHFANVSAKKRNGETAKPNRDSSSRPFYSKKKVEIIDICSP